jgi:hypothetical protein
MAIETFPSPNPNAMKFVVGTPVGGPTTVVRGADTEHGFAAELLGTEGVVSVFFTADFVTITKSPTAGWESILPQAVSILEREFGG